MEPSPTYNRPPANIAAIGSKGSWRQSDLGPCNSLNFFVYSSTLNAAPGLIHYLFGCRGSGCFGVRVSQNVVKLVITSPLSFFLFCMTLVRVRLP